MTDIKKELSLEEQQKVAEIMERGQKICDILHRLSNPLTRTSDAVNDLTEHMSFRADDDYYALANGVWRYTRDLLQLCHEKAKEVMQ